MPSEMTRKIDMSLKRIETFQRPEGLYLAFSGGKDSVVCKHLLDMAGAKYDAHYRVTSVDPPELVRFIRDTYAGVGLYTAEIIGDICEKNETLSLTCVVPWEEQAAKWTPELRERYFNVQAKCTNVETVSRQKTENCDLDAKLRAVDLADSVFFVAAAADDAALAPIFNYVRDHV